MFVEQNLAKYNFSRAPRPLRAHAPFEHVQPSAAIERLQDTRAREAEKKEKTVTTSAKVCLNLIPTPNRVNMC